MSKLKIAMIEYQGRCDETGKAVGHAPKVLKEYYNFIKDHFEVEILAPATILKECPEEITKNAFTLNENIVMKGHKTFKDKIDGKLSMFKNIKQAVKNTDADILWFFNVEYYIMLYFGLNRKPSGKKMVFTMFKEGFSGGFAGKIRQFFFGLAQKKIDLIIKTGQGFKYKNTKSVFVSDYYYDEEKYKAYKTDEKENLAVCLGTMGDGKQLEELVESFGKTDYPLKIAGRFYNKERFNKLKESASDNISIEDKYLSEEEYFTLLSKARYTVLPYSKTGYYNQTSGVLQEAVFLDTIPIANVSLLNCNEIKGIGFEDWKDMNSTFFKNLDMKEDALNNNYYREYKELRENRFSKQKISDSYESIFKNLY